MQYHLSHKTQFLDDCFSILDTWFSYEQLRIESRIKTQITIEQYCIYRMLIRILIY